MGVVHSWPGEFGSVPEGLGCRHVWCGVFFICLFVDVSDHLLCCQLDILPHLLLLLILTHALLQTNHLISWVTMAFAQRSPFLSPLFSSSYLCCLTVP